MTDLIQFLESAEIPPKARRAALRAAAKHIQSDQPGAVDTSMLPDDLKDKFRRLVIIAHYQARSIGEKFNPNREYMPTAGRAISSQLTVNVRL